jgi:hypothetical protein
MKKTRVGSDVTEDSGSGEDDVTQDEEWFWLEASSTSINFDDYVSADQELMMCGMLCPEEMCGVVQFGGGKVIGRKSRGKEITRKTKT